MKSSHFAKLIMSIRQNLTAGLIGFRAETEKEVVAHLDKQLQRYKESGPDVFAMNRDISFEIHPLGRKFLLRLEFEVTEDDSFIINTITLYADTNKLQNTAIVLMVMYFTGVKAAQSSREVKEVKFDQEITPFVVSSDIWRKLTHSITNLKLCYQTDKGMRLQADHKNDVRVNKINKHMLSSLLIACSHAHQLTVVEAD